MKVRRCKWRHRPAREEISNNINFNININKTTQTPINSIMALSPPAHPHPLRFWGVAAGGCLTVLALSTGAVVGPVAGRTGASCERPKIRGRGQRPQNRAGERQRQAAGNRRQCPTGGMPLLTGGAVVSTVVVAGRFLSAGPR